MIVGDDPRLGPPVFDVVEEHRLVEVGGKFAGGTELLGRCGNRRWTVSAWCSCRLGAAGPVPRAVARCSGGGWIEAARIRGPHLRAPRTSGLAWMAAVVARGRCARRLELDSLGRNVAHVVGTVQDLTDRGVGVCESSLARVRGSA